MREELTTHIAHKDVLRERPCRDFDAERADLITDAMTTITRYPLLDVAVKALFAGRYSGGGVGKDDFRNCAERAKHDEIW